MSCGAGVVRGDRWAMGSVIGWWESFDGVEMRGLLGGIRNEGVGCI